jgi:hypothetical protein
MLRSCAEVRRVKRRRARQDGCDSKKRVMDYKVRKLDGGLCYTERGSLMLQVGSKIREWAELVTLDSQMTMRRWEG